MFGSKFWGQVAGDVAQKWTERIFSPALVFWGGGFLAYAMSVGWTPLVDQLTGLQEIQGIVLIVAALLLVAGSAMVVETLQRHVVRFLEGYWPSFLDWLQGWLVERSRARHTKVRERWRELAIGYQFQRLTPEEEDEYVRLDAELATYPSPDRLLPTGLGNRMRAAEEYAFKHYGLATGVVWPRLWLVMPEAARNELTKARESLEANARLVVWSLAFLVWLGWVPQDILAWASVIALGLAGVVWGYWRASTAAGVYGDLMRTAFDLYRHDVYKTLRLPLPETPADERLAGMELTQYLWRGSDRPTPKFTTAGSRGSSPSKS